MTNQEMLDYVIKSIKLIRKQKHISQIELCLRANMSQGFLTSLENGKQEPSTMTLIRIANALEVNPRDFFPKELPDSQDNDSVKNKMKKEIIEMIYRL